MTHLSRSGLEAHARGLFADYPVVHVGGSIVRARILGVFDLFLDENEQSLSPYILRNTPGIWEASVTRAISRYVQPGMVAIDAGSNIGYVALLLAAGLHASRVVAIEPLDQVRALLVRSVEANGLQSVVHVDRRALWATSGAEVVLRVMGDLLGCTTITGPTFGSSTFTSSQRASTITLDDLLDELAIERVDFVKIDCEGSEAKIWRGMQRTWERNPELVVLAEHFTAPEGPAFLHELRASGARVRLVDGEGDVVEFTGGAPTYGMLWVTR